MFPNLLDIACRQGAEARALASYYVSRYGIDAAALARMARADLIDCGKVSRSLLYERALAILAHG